jgi:uncharacterized membrane protein YqjE
MSSFGGGFLKLSLVVKKFYMLGLAAVCWAIWKSRKRACFAKNKIHRVLV